MVLHSKKAWLSLLGCIALNDMSMAQNATGTTSGILAVSSPTWLPSFPLPAGVATSYPTGPIPTGANLSTQTLNLSAYPTPWTSPPTDNPELQAVINSIDWSMVPNATVQKGDANGDLDMSGYDATQDPYCWWSDTNCVTPKVSYLPQDIYYCPRPGDWGLTYDDGPFNPTGNATVDAYAEPALYNFLAEHNQKATLFYIGSNVVTYPAAAQRAINDGHTICVHTWSHPSMTTQTNEQVVGEFYWTLRAIKEAVGVTPRCWRPPYGDVDDRVRAIAWQMGLRTIIWDEDSNDWNLEGADGGTLPASTVNGYFETWIESRKNGSDNTQGHIVLEHELNQLTVAMAENWLPQIQQVFNVVPVHECMNISQPYWETSWVYPTDANPNATQATPSGVSASGSSVPTSGSASGEETPATVANIGTGGAGHTIPSSILPLVASVATLALTVALVQV